MREEILGRARIPRPGVARSKDEPIGRECQTFHHDVIAVADGRQVRGALQIYRERVLLFQPRGTLLAGGDVREPRRDFSGFSPMIRDSVSLLPVNTAIR